MRRGDWDHGGRTANQRGYGTRWQRLRVLVLAREPLCRACTAAGRTTPASHVDHIVPKARGGSDDVDNLQPLCRKCHEAKTIAEKSTTPRGAGADGMPIDHRHPWARARG